ncbi:M50 family metallopeptidase [Streptomyces acidiscabies]|uniref:Site-2 protease family protein n=1 Tax=Streptomyces acidiscabies TaxID=42234 RepID=A0AAP6BHY5_9ACTN|nr:site-2 protease family protein [Streptomyces acidiscabies]MBP5936474.1 site-2 protease family protein [Streptomyces sp. LBUM 1476]MBZ3915552.1 site-2 protease family protein [Streptomyces acidiscabies]MDX2965084.1 site-2 protease family protein [Streptomyces acidiscabies]MDX3022547.1 site-2 protease family protein [Streptomyces acidiscabies]MDX3796107.1 site-2 protease family protein [Streptomyces acidiscabies]
MTALMMILGIVVFVLGLLFSIAWHELGHFTFAKLFGIRVPQFMVGFGPTVFSRKKGETEYGVKAIPMGGYIRMIGMFPPGEDGRISTRSTSPWRTMIEDARSASMEEIQPGDETRMMYTRKPWKRVIIMAAGPVQNLILAVILFLTVLMGFGISQQTTTVSSVSQCVINQSENRDTCKTGDAPSPAAAAGLKAGDKIVSFDGVRTEKWDSLSDLIRASADKTVPIVVQRDGKEVTLRAKIAENQVAKKDSSGQIVQGQYVKAGFLGFSAASGIVQQDFGDSVTWMTDRVGEAVDSIVALPGKIPALWDAAFDGGKREADSPMGVVGAARVGGEIFTLDIPPSQQLAMALMLVAGFNLSLFLFNMLPLLPLDGGHIAGALWESLRRNLARVLRRPDPGPFDVAKLMPLAYVVAGVFICFTILVLIADVVNPVKIS